jgi:transcriptional regulator GlxA family with amidase domain
MMRLFKSHSAMSVWEYVVRLRVSHAQGLLITTNHKITDIAIESGFGSVAPFYAAYEKFGGGKTPTAFRQAHRCRQLVKSDAMLQKSKAGNP